MSLILPAGHRPAACKDVEGPILLESDLERSLLLLIERDFLAEEYIWPEGSMVDPYKAQIVVQRNLHRLDNDQIEHFLKMAYRHSKRPYIHHFLDSEPLRFLGQGLPKDRLMYVTSPTDIGIGRASEGVIVNVEESRNLVGSNMLSSSVVIQASPVKMFSNSHRKGLVISTLEGSLEHEEESYHYPTIRSDASDELIDYCNHVVRICGSGESAVYETFGDVPANTIRENIYGLACWRPGGWRG